MLSHAGWADMGTSIRPSRFVKMFPAPVGGPPPRAPRRAFGAGLVDLDVPCLQLLEARVVAVAEMDAVDVVRPRLAVVGHVDVELVDALTVDRRRALDVGRPPILRAGDQ